MKRFGRVLVLVVLAGFLVPTLAACGSDGDDETQDSADELRPEDISKRVPGRLSITVEGDASFTYEDAVDLRIVTIQQPGEEGLKFLSVGMDDISPLVTGGVFRVAFDLAGEYDGPGSYELPAIGGATPPPPRDPTNANPNEIAAGLSRVYLTYNPDGDFTKDQAVVGATKSFDQTIKPCSIEVGREARSGRLTCPEVSDVNGNTVSIEMEWRAR